MKLASNVVSQEELFLSQKGTNNSSYLMVTTPDKRNSFKIDFQQTRERPHYFLQIWSDHENERRAFANNSTRVASIVRFQIPTTNFTYSLRVFFFYISGTATWMKNTGQRARISCSRAHPRGYRLWQRPSAKTQKRHGAVCLEPCFDPCLRSTQQLYWNSDCSTKPVTSSDRDRTSTNPKQPRFHARYTRISVDTVFSSTGAKFELSDVATHFQSRSQFHPSELH